MKKTVCILAVLLCAPATSQSQEFQASPAGDVYASVPEAIVGLAVATEEGGRPKHVIGIPSHSSPADYGINGVATNSAGGSATTQWGSASAEVSGDAAAERKDKSLTSSSSSSFEVCATGIATANTIQLRSHSSADAWLRHDGEVPENEAIVLKGTAKLKASGYGLLDPGRTAVGSVHVGILHEEFGIRLHGSHYQIDTGAYEELPEGQEVKKTFLIEATPGHMVYVNTSSTVHQGAQSSQFPPGDNTSTSSDVSISIEIEAVKLKRGDINADGIVDFADFLILSANIDNDDADSWGEGDLNNDYVVDFDDFLILSENF